MLSGVTTDALKNYYSTIEETRADLERAGRLLHSRLAVFMAMQTDAVVGTGGQVVRGNNVLPAAVVLVAGALTLCLAWRHRRRAALVSARRQEESD